MTGVRLPAALEVSGMVRHAQALGGFAMVLRKGEPDAGTILVVCVDADGLGTLYERLPDAVGERRWSITRRQDREDRFAFDEYLDRRAKQDGDVWIVELTVADGERSILDAR